MIVIRLRCKVCVNAWFRNSTGLSHHIRVQHKLTRKDYYVRYLKAEGEGMCARPGCTNLTRFTSIDNGFVKHCSNSCGLLNMPEETKSKWKLGLQKTWKEKKPEEVSELVKRREKTLAKRYGKNFKLELNKRTIKGHIKKYGVSNPSQLEQVQAKCLATRKSRSPLHKYKSKLKRRATFLSKYGVTHGMHLEKVRSLVIKKARETRITKGLQVKDQVNFSKYRGKVHWLTKAYGLVDIPKSVLAKIGRCGVSGALQIDHILGIKEGFESNIPAELIAHPANLQVVSWEANLNKRWTQVITKKELYKRIRLYEKTRAA